MPGSPRSLTGRHRLSGPLDLTAVTFPLRQGRDDPTIRVRPGQVWRALRTSDGPAVLHLRVEADELLTAAEGPGGEAALELAPALAGLRDQPELLRPAHPAVRDAVRRHPGLRLTSGTPVFDALVPAVLTQKVVGLDARAAFRDLVRRCGEPAPGGSRLLLPPSAATLARLPYWIFHCCNVERRRADVVRHVAGRASSIDGLRQTDSATAAARLRTLPGVGAWTAAEVVSVSHGDTDAVPLGDYHLPHLVAWALAGRPRGDDELMLHLLEPYSGQRGRVIRLLAAAGWSAPRFGPPTARRDISRL